MGLGYISMGKEETDVDEQNAKDDKTLAEGARPQN